MVTQTIELRNGTLKGTLYSPLPSDQLIVICHGYRGSSTHPALARAAKGLNKKGHTTFTFDFSDPRGMDVPRQAGDLASIVKHFKKEYSSIILLGGSFGALSASIAARQLDIAGLVTVNGFFGQAKLGRVFMPTFLLFRLLALASPLHKNIWEFYKREFHPQEITVPTLVIHAKKDEMVSFAQSQDFFARLHCPKQFVGLANADHNLTSDASTAAVVGAVNEWLKASISQQGQAARENMLAALPSFS